MAFSCSSPLLIAAASLTLAGCVAQGPFPSLAPRPGEGEISMMEPARVDPAVPDDAALRRQVAELEAQAARGQRAFASAEAATAAAVGRAGAEGSRSWTEAQQALSRLEAARGDTATAVAALDRLSTERADMPTSTADAALIAAAIAETGRISEAQQARIAALESRLRR